jgi:hypothetical protein
MIETAMVFTKDGRSFYWHDIKGRTAGFIPDSRVLWDVIWIWRDVLGGVAHTHLCDGPSAPSPTDITTFRAIESALGRNLIWPIVTMTHVNFFGRHFTRSNIGHYGLIPDPFFGNPNWKNAIELLRLKSREEIP